MGLDGVELLLEFEEVIVMEQLGLAEAEYREDADFIRDFGMA